MISRYLAGILVLIFILSNVNALDYHYFAEVTSVELRGDYDSDWGYSINAEDNDAIDIRAQIFLDYYDYYGNSPYYYEEVEAYADVYGWNNGWIFLRKTDTRHISINYANYKTVYWYDAFFVDGQYSQYKVVVKARTTFGYSDTGSNTAYIDTVGQGFDSYCDDIEIFSNSLSMQEDDTDYITFNIKNNSDERFYINGVSALDSESFFGIFSYSNDSSISAGDVGQVKLRAVSSEVNGDEEGTATLRIKGEFNSGKTCDYSDIEKDFTVRVLDEFNNQVCSDIEIFASNKRMQENSTEYFDFTVRNQSNTRFYIDSYDVSDDSSYFITEEDYKPAYINANSENELTYKVKSNNVSSNNSGTIKIRVSGHYSGGDSCSYAEIGEKRITLTIEDDYWNGNGNCDDLELKTNSLYLDEDDIYTTSFSVENNSGQDFYVEGIDFEENSSALNFSNIDFPDYVSANDEKNISFEARTNLVSSTQNITSYFKVKGRFENGETCSFTDTRKGFNVKINNSGSFSSNCNEIDIITKTVSLKKGETKDFEFTIENNENRKFYLDEIDIYDNDSGIDSKEYNYPSVIYPNDSETITARITAKETGTATAYIEIKGHYENGESCSASQIGKESFSVRVDGTTDSCSDFYLDVPSIKSVLGKEDIILNINNPTNKTGTIKISGTNLSVSPYLIDVPANRSFSKTIEVELLEGKESYLVYDISLSGCNITSKTTKIVSATESFEILNYPSNKIISLNDSISFTIKNNDSSSKEFYATLQEIPSGWKVNEKIVVLPANSDRTINLEIQAGETGTYNVLLVVQSGTRKIEKNIQLTVEEKEINVSAEITSGVLNEKELKIIIENNTSEEINGNAVIDLPENWTMQGNTKISVEPETKKEISFKLNTDGTEKEIPVTIELDNGKKLTATAEPASTGMTTALASLAQNAGLALGLLAIIIIVVILLVKRQ